MVPKIITRECLLGLMEVLQEITKMDDKIRDKYFMVVNYLVK